MARILVIDDNDDTRKMLCEVLEKKGHKLLEASNGKNGLDLFKKDRADLVITDLFMPVKNGFETIMSLQKDSPETRIIAISGLTGIVDLLPASKELGAWDTLSKPFSKNQILSLVDRALESENNLSVA